MTGRREERTKGKEGAGLKGQEKEDRAKKKAVSFAFIYDPITYGRK